MSVSVIVKYPGIEETSRLDNVPYTCTLQKLKKIIIKLNKFEGDPSKVLLVRNGSVLKNDEQTVGDLPLDDENSTSIFVTGIKSRIKQQPIPEEPPVEETNEVQQEAPRPQIPIQPQWNNLNNVNQGPRRGRNGISGLVSTRNFIIACICLFAFSGLLIAFIYRKKVIGKTPEQKKAEHAEKIAREFKKKLTQKPDYGKQSHYGPYIGIALVLLFFVRALMNVKWTLNLAMDSVVVFFKSLLPTWNGNAFANEHQINRPQ